MIIKTRYRDIPWSEVADIHSMMPMTDGACDLWERKVRGAAIAINTQSRRTSECGVHCFDVVEPTPTGARIYACEHIAEIGD